MRNVELLCLFSATVHFWVLYNKKSNILFLQNRSYYFPHHNRGIGFCYHVLNIQIRAVTDREMYNMVRDGLHLIAWQTLPTAFITAGSGREEWKHASFTVLRSSLRFISLAKGSCAFLIIMPATVSWWVKIMLCLGFHKHKLSKNNNYCQAKQLMGWQFSSEAVPITLC